MYVSMTVCDCTSDSVRSLSAEHVTAWTKVAWNAMNSRVIVRAAMCSKLKNDPLETSHRYFHISALCVSTVFYAHDFFYAHEY
jgi:hypothetical protein